MIARFLRPRRFLLLLIPLLLAAAATYWWLGKNSQPAPEAAAPASGATASREPWALSRTIPSSSAGPTAAPPTAQLAQAGTISPGSSASLKSAAPQARRLPPVVVAGRKSGSEDSPASPEGIFRRTSVYETSFKYPLLRVEEQILRGVDGVETVVRQNVMVADHLMVQLNPRVSDEDFRAWLAERQLLVRRKIPNSLLYLVEVPEPSVAAYDAALVAFADKTSPAVSAEPDYIVQNHAEATPPNDPSFGTLWNLHNTGQSGGVAGADVNALTAWSVSVGSANVVVGVIDTGMDMDHPDLAANLWTNASEIPNDGIDNDNNGYVDDVHGWNFVKNTNSPEDDYGHGTHTAGTVGAVGNNGNGVTGVCQQVKIMPLKFLDHTGSGSDSDAIEAIYYATAKGVLLTSNSWGGGDFTLAMETAIKLAGTAGVGFIAAAGNDGLDNDIIPSYPANYECDNLISVAATDASDQLSFFSNYGKTSVHLAAPGEDVYSTYLSGGYAYSSGTSMAAPHVSGAAALLKAANPGMNFAQIKAALLAKTDPVANLANKTMTGGRLDVGNAIDLAVVAYPVMTKATVQDATGPDTSGNGDSIVSPGETVAVALEVQNLGGVPTGVLQGTLSLDTPDAKVSLANTTLTFGAVAPAAKVQNAAPNLLITVAADHATPASIPLTLTLTDGAGVNRTESLTLNIYTVTTIAGHVTKVTGGTGLEGATVKLTGTVTKETTTGPDGGYIATVVDGDYSVQARAPGYVTSATQNVNVPPSAAGVDFVLGASQLALDIPTLHPSVPEGGSTNQEITFTNNGDVPLIWNFERLPGADPPASLALDLAPGLASKRKPVYLPASIGVRSPEEGLPAGRKLVPHPKLSVKDNNTAVLSSLPFVDSFEDGTTNKWFESWTDAHREVVSNTSADGAKSFRFNLAGPDDHFSGVHQEFNSGLQPGYTSFWIRTAARDLATAYMVMCDVSGPYLVDFIWFFAHPNGRFYLNADVGGNQLFSYQKDTWYHIEYRNINWTTKTFDYVVNGIPVQSAVPFRNPTVANQCIAAFAYNYSGGVDAWWDDVRFTSQSVDWLTLSSESGSLPPGQTATITVNYDASQLLAGEYKARLRLKTNQPDSPVNVLPVTLNVTPVANNVPVANSSTIETSEDSNTLFSLSGTDADPADQSSLSYYVTQLPSRGRLFQVYTNFEPAVPITTAPTLVLNGNHQLLYMPESNEHGSPYASFQFTVRDKRSESTPATVIFNVASIADIPVVKADQASIQPGQSLPRLAVLTNDYSPENLPLSIQSFSQPTEGTVTSNGDGTLAFVPNPGFLSGVTSFSYTATDGTRIASAMVTLHVGGLRTGSWTTQGRDSYRTGFFPASVPTLQTRWTGSVSGTPTDPVIAEDKVYVIAHGDDGMDQSRAFDLATGTLIWSQTDANPSVHLNAPLYYDSALFHVQSNPGGYSRITATDASTGLLNWSATFEGTQSEQGKALLGTLGLVHLPGGPGPKLYGVYPFTPSAAFITPLPGAQTGTFTEAGSLLLTATGGAIHALDWYYGMLRWSLRPKGADITSNATVAWEAGDAVVNLQGQIHCISTVQTPHLKWSSTATEHLFTPLLAWGQVLAVNGGSNPTLKIYDRSTGSLLQSFAIPASPTSQPIVTQDCMVVSTNTATYIIRLSDGTLQQTLPTGGFLAAADNTLVVANPTSRMVNAFGAPPLVHFHPGSTASTTSIDVKTGVTIPEAVIYYTTDGSTPTDQSPTLTNLSSMRFLRTTTLKSIGIHSEFKGPVTTEVFTITDANTNGLPDWWEQQYGGQRAVPVTTLDPALDDDGDFLSNLQEFVAGTNPNSADTLMTPGQTSDGAGITLTWPGQLGRFYSALTSQDLKVWETVTDATQKPGTGGTMTWTDANGIAAGRKFYRIVISVP